MENSENGITEEIILSIAVAVVIYLLLDAH